MKLSPVTLPPGRARLLTRPDFTGSATRMMTIGTVLVARFMALAAGVFTATTTSGLNRISSSASALIRSCRPPPFRTSIVMFLPSTYPRSRSPSRNASSNPGCATSCDSTPTR